MWNVCLVTQLCPTLCNPMECSPPGSSVHGDSPGKNTGVNCHALLQEIFPTQGWMEPRSPILQADSLPSEPPVGCWAENLVLHATKRCRIWSLFKGEEKMSIKIILMFYSLTQGCWNLGIVSEASWISVVEDSVPKAEDMKSNLYCMWHAWEVTPSFSRFTLLNSLRIFWHKLDTKE